MRLTSRESRLADARVRLAERALTPGGDDRGAAALAAALAAARAAGAAGRKARRRDADARADRPSASCSSTCRATAARRAPWPRCGRASRRRSRCRCARSPRGRCAGAACARWSRRPCSTRPGTMRATFFNQPWLVQRYPPGTRLLLHGKADERGGFRVSHHAVGAQARLGADSPAASGPATERRARRGAPAVVGPLSRDRGRHLDADPHARAGRQGRAGRRARAAARRHARRRAAARPGERAGGDALPAARATPSRDASGWPSRSCC